MSTIRHRTAGILLIATVVLTVVLSGCGSDETGSPDLRTLSGRYVRGVFAATCGDVDFAGQSVGELKSVRRSLLDTDGPVWVLGVRTGTPRQTDIVGPMGPEYQVPVVVDLRDAVATRTVEAVLTFDGHGDVLYAARFAR